MKCLTPVNIILILIANSFSGSSILNIDMKVFPGKIFRRQSGMPGQSIHGLKFPNTSNENLMMFDRFRQLADESTGIPSYSHGTTGVQSTTRTAAGMSMLMGAAALNVKTVVKNIDEILFEKIFSIFGYSPTKPTKCKSRPYNCR